MTDKIKKAVKNQTLKIIGHPKSDFDSLASGILLHELLEILGIKSEIVIDEPIEKNVALFAERIDFPFAEYYGNIEKDDVLFLVDHHETKYKNFVVGCIDHHHTDRKYSYPIYINSSSSSCALSVLRLMEKLLVKPTKRQIFIAVLSVFADTKSCKSTKFVKSDRAWLDECIKKYSFDEEELIRFGFCIDDISRDVEKLALNEYKEYLFQKNLVCTSHIQVKRCDCLEEKISKICDFLISERCRRKASIWVFIVSEPYEEWTEVVRIDGCRVSRLHYDSLISRSVDIIPKIEREFLENC